MPVSPQILKSGLVLQLIMILTKVFGTHIWDVRDTPPETPDGVDTSHNGEQNTVHPAL